MPLAFLQRDRGCHAQEHQREDRPVYRPDGGDHGRDQGLEVARNIGMDSVEEVPQNSRACRGQQRAYR